MCADIRIDTIYASGNLFCLYLVCAKSPAFIGGSLRSRVSAVSVAIAVNTATIAARFELVACFLENVFHYSVTAMILHIACTVS